MTPLTPKELELARSNGSEEEIAEFNRLIAEKHELDQRIARLYNKLFWNKHDL